MMYTRSQITGSVLSAAQDSGQKRLADVSLLFPAKHKLQKCCNCCVNARCCKSGLWATLTEAQKIVTVFI